MSNWISSCERRRWSQLLVGTSLVVLGCNPDLDDLEIFPMIDGTIEFSVSHRGVDPQRIERGIFVAGTCAESWESGDGADDDEPELCLRASTSRGGRVVPEFEPGEPLLTGTYEFRPVALADGDLERSTLELPEVSETAEWSHIVVVWYDADDDGLLDLSGSEPSEFARVIQRTDADDTVYFTDVTPYDDGTWRAGAVREPREGGPSEATSFNDEWKDGWTVEIGRDFDPPLQ